MTVHRIRRLFAAPLAGLAAILLAAAPAVAGGAPALRPHVTVESGLVTLGDLFENAGEAADIAVFRAPDPGEVGTVSTQRIREAASRHGIEWSNPGRVASVSVARASTEVPLAAIREAIAAAARARLGAGTSATIDVALDARSRPLHLVSRADARFEVSRLEINADTGSFVAEIRPLDEAAGPVREIYRGRAVETVEVPVLLGTIARGSEIRAGDVAIRAVPRREVPYDALTDIAEVVGKAARRNLLADAPVRGGDVKAPKLVTRNGTVTLTYRSNALTITALGRSLDDAAEGEPVRVLNLRSRRIVDAVVTGRNSATVTGGNVPGLNLAAAETN